MLEIKDHFDHPLPADVAEIVRPMLLRASKVISVDYEFLYVSWGVDDPRASCAMTCMCEYRYCVLRIGPLWLNSSAEERARDLIHECVHTMLNPLAENCDTIIEVMSKENTTSALLNLMRENKRMDMERVVCDITNRLFPFIFPEFSNGR